MADIIEEIGDLIDEEDKGDVRTATRAVEISNTNEATKVTIDDLVSVEEVVSILVSDNGTDYKSVYDAGDSFNEIVGGYKNSISDNEVSVGYIGTDGSDKYTKDLTSTNHDAVGNGPPAVTHVKVIARGY